MTPSGGKNHAPAGDPLAPAECQEALQSSRSYYPNDLLVVGWAGALVYDSQEAADPTIQLLEYANTQLLEFRHYDELLTNVLAQVYKKLDRRGKLLRHWRWRSWDGSDAARVRLFRVALDR